MKCQEFKELLNDLASDRLMDAAARKSALAHQAVCPSCAEQLTRQRALTADLRAFAEATETLRAAPRVKQQLRAALLEQHAAPVTSAPVIALASFKKTKATGPHWAWAAAAAAVLLLCGALWAVWRPANQVALEHLAISNPPAPPVAPPPQTPPPVTMLRPQPAKAARRAPQRNQTLVQATLEEENEADFVPLTLAVDERALENRTLVRLEVPRTRLVALGLPLPAHGASETVNAEVMMGDDGVAYAIRLIR
jgi:hypothetical protein